MSIKDLFNSDTKVFQAPQDNIQSASLGAESTEYIKQKQKQKYTNKKYESTKDAKYKMHDLILFEGTNKNPKSPGAVSLYVVYFWIVLKHCCMCFVHQNTINEEYKNTKNAKHKNT